MLDSVKDTIEDVIKTITRKPNITPAELEHLTKSVCLLEKIKTIEDSGNYDEVEYSQRRSHNSYNNSRMHDPRYENGYYDSNGSYRSFESGNSSRRYYDGGSRNSGYSGHSIKDRMIARLEDMYDEARTEHERQIVQEWINRLSRD